MEARRRQTGYSPIVRHHERRIVLMCALIPKCIRVDANGHRIPGPGASLRVRDVVAMTHDATECGNNNDNCSDPLELPALAASASLALKLSHATFPHSGHVAPVGRPDR